jgi:predicted DNA-binding transcriptional regulator YafY
MSYQSNEMELFMQISRLFEIVYLLMNKKSMTAKELSRHFEVSQRTIYRDIETLCEAGIPIYTNKGKGGGIALMEHFVLNKSVLSEQEQNDILSALQGFQATSYPDTEKVLSKLNSLFGDKNANWVEVDFSNWNNNEEEKAKFNLLKEAILNRKVIEFDYYSSYGNHSHRITYPQKLIFKGQAWYLYSYCKDKEDYRYFKISRIKELYVLSDNFITTPPPVIHKDVPALEDLTPMVTVVLKVDASMAYRIFDEFPTQSLIKNEDGSFQVRANVQAGVWLLGYLMSYEEHLEVIEPLELREALIQKYKSALKRYEI